MEIPPSVFVSSYKRRIVDEYKSDMVKYAATADKSRIRECFESIPAQLARGYKKFSYSVVRPGGRGRDYADSLQWIEDAGIIRQNDTARKLPTFYISHELPRSELARLSTYKRKRWAKNYP